MKSGKRFLALCLLFSIQVHAQKSSVNELPFLIEDFSKVGASPICEVNSEEEGICSCSRSESDDSNAIPFGERVILKVTSSDDIPESLKSIVVIDKAHKISKEDPLYFSFSHMNDNWPALRGIDSMGLTGTLKFEVGGVMNKNGKPLAWGGYAYSALYSQRVLDLTNKKTGEQSQRIFEGDWESFGKSMSRDEVLVKRPNNHQKTLNQENTLIGFFINNKPRGHVISWSLDGGLGVTDTNKGIMMHPVQGLWHHIPGLIKYDRVWDGNDRVYSAFLKGAILAQKNILDKKSCTIGLKGSSKFSMDTSGKRNFVVVDVGSDVGIIESGDGQRKILGFDSGMKIQMPIGSGKMSSSATAGMTVDMRSVRVQTGYMAPVMGNYIEEYKANYSRAQKMGYVRIIYVLPGIK